MMMPFYDRTYPDWLTRELIFQNKNWTGLTIQGFEMAQGAERTIGIRCSLCMGTYLGIHLWNILWQHPIFNHPKSMWTCKDKRACEIALTKRYLLASVGDIT